MCLCKCGRSITKPNKEPQMPSLKCSTFRIVDHRFYLTKPAQWNLIMHNAQFSKHKFQPWQRSKHRALNRAITKHKKTVEVQTQVGRDINVSPWECDRRVMSHRYWAVLMKLFQKLLVCFSQCSRYICWEDTNRSTGQNRTDHFLYLCQCPLTQSTDRHIHSSNIKQHINNPEQWLYGPRRTTKFPLEQWKCCK